MAGNVDERLLARTVCVVGLVLFIVGAFWLITYESGYSLDEQAKAVAILKDVLEIAAVIIGGAWTLRVYLVSRSESESVAVEQTVVVLRLPDERYLLRVFATAKNIGKVEVRLMKWRVRADLLLPLSPNVTELLATRNAFSERSARWKTLTDAEQGTFSGADFEITVGPGESELQIGNLVLPRWAEVVQIYSHFQRRDSAATEGWSQRTMVDLRPEEAS